MKFDLEIPIFKVNNISRNFKTIFLRIQNTIFCLQTLNILCLLSGRYIDHPAAKGLNISKHCFKVVRRFLREQTRHPSCLYSFLIPNFSGKIFCTRFIGMFTISVISQIFSQRTSNLTSWNLLTVSSVVTSIGRSGRSSSKTDVGQLDDAWINWTSIW